MGFITEYPMTNFHELNADYLLKRMHELEQSMQDLDAHIHDVVNSSMQPYITELNSLISRYAALDARVTQTLTNYSADIAAQNAKIDNEFRRITAYNQAQLEAMRNNLALDLARGLDNINRQFIVWRTQANNQLADMQRYMMTEVNILNRRMDLFEAEFRLELQEFLENLPESFVVTSPYSGQIVSIQEAINELYDNVSRYRAITAGEFDALGMTAEEFDDLELTAWEFDIYGLDYLPVRDTLHNMTSPFTGEWSSLQTVINEIVNFEFREHALTASEFDALELTAGELDAEPFTAYDFDFIGKDILAA